MQHVSIHHSLSNDRTCAGYSRPLPKRVAKASTARACDAGIRPYPPWIKSSSGNDRLWGGGFLKQSIRTGQVLQGTNSTERCAFWSPRRLGVLTTTTALKESWVDIRFVLLIGLCQELGRQGTNWGALITFKSATRGRILLLTPSWAVPDWSSVKALPTPTGALTPGEVRKWLNYPSQLDFKSPHLAGQRFRAPHATSCVLPICYAIQHSIPGEACEPSI